MQVCADGEGSMPTEALLNRNAPMARQTRGKEGGKRRSANGRHGYQHPCAPENDDEGVGGPVDHCDPFAPFARLLPTAALARLLPRRTRLPPKREPRLSTPNR